MKNVCGSSRLARMASVGMMAVVGLIVAPGLAANAHVDSDADGFSHSITFEESMSGSGNVFVVYGIVYESDGITDWGTRGRIIVFNTRTKANARSGIGATESGKYAAAFVDFISNLAVCDGDTLEFVIPAGEMITPSWHVLMPAEVDEGKLRYDILANPVVVRTTHSTWGRIKALFID